ncbi:MAG: hypothetical protein MUP73_05675 [Dehalococcoidia bacterium]|nr:hypothetical protein [Dehalococcoidia bacterium]
MSSTIVILHSSSVATCHCEELSDEAIPGVVVRHWDCRAPRLTRYRSADTWACSPTHARGGYYPTWIIRSSRMMTPGPRQREIPLASFTPVIARSMAPKQSLGVVAKQ